MRVLWIIDNHFNNMALFFEDISEKKQEAIIEYLKDHQDELDTDVHDANEDELMEAIDDHINCHNNTDWILEMLDKI